MRCWLLKELGSTASSIRFRLGMWALWGAYELTLFRVNTDVPLLQVLEQASTLLYYAKTLSLEAAMEEQVERYA